MLTLTMIEIISHVSMAAATSAISVTKGIIAAHKPIARRPT